MPKSQLTQFIDYRPAELKEGKRWYINFYVKDPTDENNWIRQQISFNRIKSVSERRKQGKKVAAEITRKLADGWNPILEGEAPKGFTKLFNALDIYIRYKKKELRPDTYRTYNSYVDKLKDWLTGIEKQNIYVLNFTVAMARDLMNNIYTNVGERTFNNNLNGYQRIWRWMIENSYASQNPFDGITKKQEKEKIRIQFIEEDDRKKIREYFIDKNRQMYVITLLAFYNLIRPKEITFLKFEYLHIDKGYIRIPGFVSKNKKERYSTIPDILLSELKIMLNQPHNDGDFLFSQNSLKPGKLQLNPRRIAKHWSNMRTAIGLEKNIQFYSLRDTGIIQKLRDGISPDEVMYQADHSSLETTNKYVKIAKPRVLQGVREKSSEF